MEDKDKHKEVCELLKIWVLIHKTWPKAKTALEIRINMILEGEI